MSRSSSSIPDTSITSFRVPKDVKVISSGFFCGCSRLESLTFEPGSKLVKIGEAAFSGCVSLKAISLPASVYDVNGDSFLRSSIREIKVDEANPYLFASGNCLIAVNGMILIRFFGVAKNLTLGRPSDSIGCEMTAAFSDDLRLTQIGRSAFTPSNNVKSIFIPASVEIIGDDSFSECSSLSHVTFESGSRLTQIGVSAFRRCDKLISICIPAQVEKIPELCFNECPSLSKVSFESNSKLIEIGFKAFDRCHSLNAFDVPSMLEIMPSGMFRSCKSLAKLIFEAPIRVRQVDLPPSDFGCIYIADSVEVVTGLIEKLEGQRRVLQFDRESRLRDIDLKEPECRNKFNWPPCRGNHVFVRVSEEALRRFRCKFEGSRPVKGESV
jgi:hypothetical protein